MSEPPPERIILTPGPVTTSAQTKQAMLRDFTPNEPDLLALTAEMRARLVAIVNGGSTTSACPCRAWATPRTRRRWARSCRATASC